MRIWSIIDTISSAAPSAELAVQLAVHPAVQPVGQLAEQLAEQLVAQLLTLEVFVGQIGNGTDYKMLQVLRCWAVNKE